MLVTDGGKLIRTAVAGIRIAGRSTQGVIVFNTADDEKVVSVERLSEEDGGVVPGHELELFTAFLLLTVILVLTPGPIVTLVLATSATRGSTRRADHRRRLRARQYAADRLHRVRPEPGHQARREIFEWLRWIGAAYLIWLGVQAWRHAGAEAAVAPPRGARLFPARLPGGDHQPEDDRLLHGVSAAVHRSKPAGGPPACPDVRGRGHDGVGAPIAAGLVLAGAGRSLFLRSASAKWLGRMSGLALIGGGCWLSLARRPG